MDAGVLIDALERAHPRAAQLALWSCLPVRVSPAFLRLARLRLLPQAGTGDEADLWLSDLVESRSGAGYAFRRAVREHLRERLRGTPAALQRLWQSVHQAHAPWLTPRARQEEDLTWRLLRDAADPAIEAIWSAVVHELDTTPHPEGLARWVTRAVPDLPAGTLDHASGRRAFHGAHLLLGDASVLGDGAQAFMDSGELAFATRRLPRRRIQVGLTARHLIVSPLQPIENGHEIEVPATQPLWLQLESAADEAGKAEPPTVLTLADDQPIVQESDFWPYTFGGGPGLRLRSIDGALHGLRLGTEPASATGVRPPRVQIEYDVEVYGSQKRVAVPFVVGVLADLAGMPVEPLPPLEDRKFLDHDVENFDSRMKRLQPRLQLVVDDLLVGSGTLWLELRFESLADWAPQRWLYRVRELHLWLTTQRWLTELADALTDGRLRADPLLGLLADRTALDRLARASLPTQPHETLAHELADLRGDIDELGRRLGVDSAGDRELAFRGAVALARATPIHGEKSLAFPDLVRGIRAVAEVIGRRLDAQIDAILHHPEFQRLEGAWRGLHHLLSQVETDEMLKVRVLHASKQELLESLRRNQGPDWDQSTLFKKIHEEEYGQFGGTPYGLLLGDYTFSHAASDVELLQRLAQIAAASFAPFLGAAAPGLFQIENWRSLAERRDLTRAFESSEYAAWRALRQSDDARYVGLALPRMLARRPWGPQGEPTDGLDHEETLGSSGEASLRTWSNAAYAMAINIARSFSRSGWFGQIRGSAGGGALQSLPSWPAPADEGAAEGAAGIVTPAELAIGSSAELDLARLGLMTLTYDRSRRVTAFVSATSLQAPGPGDDPEATTRDAELAAQWPHLLAGCRFMHYLKCMTRDRFGSDQTPEDLQRRLNDWIMNYVDGDPARSYEFTQARYPLAAAEVNIDPVEGQPPSWQMSVRLRPHHQLEGLSTSLRFVTSVPAP